MYADGFDFENIGISVRETGFVFQREESDLNTGSLICVENPINPSKDLGN